MGSSLDPLHHTSHLAHQHQISHLHSRYSINSTPSHNLRQPPQAKPIKLHWKLMYWHPTVLFLLCYSQFSTEPSRWPFLKTEMKSCHSSKPTTGFHSVLNEIQTTYHRQTWSTWFNPCLCLWPFLLVQSSLHWFIPFPLAEILLPPIFMWLFPLFDSSLWSNATFLKSFCLSCLFKMRIYPPLSSHYFSSKHLPLSDML